MSETMPLPKYVIIYQLKNNLILRNMIECGNNCANLQKAITKKKQKPYCNLLIICKYMYNLCIGSGWLLFNYVYPFSNPTFLFTPPTIPYGIGHIQIWVTHTGEFNTWNFVYMLFCPQT